MIRKFCSVIIDLMWFAVLLSLLLSFLFSCAKERQAVAMATFVVVGGVKVSHGSLWIMPRSSAFSSGVVFAIDGLR